MDMLVSGESSPAEVSDKIKEILYTKEQKELMLQNHKLLEASSETKLKPNEVVDEVESEEDEEETQTGDEDDFLRTLLIGTGN